MASPPGTGVLIVWVDLDPALSEVADRWYEREHLPERITDAGYLTAQRFRSTSGAPEYMAVFEASTPDALASDGYKRITQSISPLSQRVRNGFRRCIRSTHVVVNSFGQASGGAVLCSRLRMREPQQVQRFTEWAREGFADWARSQPAVLSGRALAPIPEVRAKMDSFRATGQSDEWVDAVVLLEFGRADVAETRKGLVDRDGLSGQGIEAQQVDVGVYQFLVGFSAR